MPSVLHRDILGQRTEDELPLKHQRMRHRQPVRIDRLTAVEKNVEIDTSRSFVNHLHPAERVFDALEIRQQVRRREACVDLDRKIVSSCL